MGHDKPESDDDVEIRGGVVRRRLRPDTLIVKRQLPQVEVAFYGRVITQLNSSPASLRTTKHPLRMDLRRWRPLKKVCIINVRAKHKGAADLLEVSN